MLQEFPSILLPVRILRVVYYVPPPFKVPKVNPGSRAYGCAGVLSGSREPAQQPAEGYVSYPPASFHVGGCPQQG